MKTRTRRNLSRVLSGLLIGILGTVIAGIILIRAEPRLKTYFFPPPRKISYFLIVQKMRDGKPYQEPFQSSGQEIFENGDKFRFKLLSPDSGHFYLLNEGAARSGRVYFNFLYPTPIRKNGAAEVGPSELIETGENEFSGTATTEKLWVVWTRNKLDQLEGAKAAAFASAGRIEDQLQEARLRSFLEEYVKNKRTAEMEIGNREAIIKGSGDVLVGLVYLEHH